MSTQSESFNWGIIGCGRIAPRFLRALEETGEGRVVAAASKSMHRARRFQQESGTARMYRSYDAMLEAEELDAVYVATSHNFHAECGRLCLERSLPVLIEKPFTQNAAQAAQLISLARQRNLFMMEALWTRFNPATVRLREALEAGLIGEPRAFDADFCVRMNPFSAKMRPWNRMCSRRLAGGALLDLGIYPVSFARMVFGRQPAHIESSADMTWTGVDKRSRYDFTYANGARAVMETSFVKAGSREAVIHGTQGRIRIPDFYRADRFTVQRDGHPDEVVPCGEASFKYEIREVHRCLREGLTESPLMPLAESLENMETLDAIRAQWKMNYPGEPSR